MKVAILAGGFGTRMTPDSDLIPKPMIEVGGRPMLWHIMQHYSAYAHRDFVVALGFRGMTVKRHFAGDAARSGNMTVDFQAAHPGKGKEGLPVWKVELIETGEDAGTGTRIRRLRSHLGTGAFMLTYGDAVSDIDLHALLDFHRSHGLPATLTAVRPPPRFGHVDLEGDRVVHFSEKPNTAEGWINGGYFVLEPEVIDYIDDGEDESFERGALARLAEAGALMAYRHHSFWQCMDTPHERRVIEQMWNAGAAPWITGS